MSTARMVARPTGRIWRPSRRMVPWLLVLPVLLLNGLVIIGPAAASVYYSMTDWSGVGSANFIGLDNFEHLFQDGDFFRALTNNLVWMGIFLTLPFGLALLAGSLLRSVRRVGLVLRLLFFIPYILPAVVVAQIWRFLYSPTSGLGAQLAANGIPGFDVALLGNPKTVLLAVAFVDNWHWWGFLMVVLLTAMQSVPHDQYEAARIDGANRWQEFRYVTLPAIRSTVIFMMLMSSIWSFLVFDYSWILTQGGPAGASEVLGTLVVKSAFYRFEAGYAAALGLTMSALAAIPIAIYFFLRRRGWEN